MQKKIQDICKEAGFYACPTSHCNRKGNQKFLALLEFACQHNKPVKKTDISPTHVQRRYASCRPSTEEERCPFIITVFCNKHDNCWYLKAGLHTKCHPCVHRGHFKLMPRDIRTPLSSIDKEEITLALQCDQIALSDGLISRLITIRSKGGNKFVSWKQIDYLLLKHKASEFINNFDNSSPAEQLLNHFDSLMDEGKGVNYVALVHSVTESFNIRFPHGRPSL
jgi:hypothetical protein